MKKIKKIPKKKIIIIAIIIAILAIGIITVALPKEKEEETIKTEAVEKRTIAKSISATGTIQTTDTKNVTSTLTGMEIATVNVKEGDTVSIGDVICTFDMSSVQDSLNQAQASLNTSQAQANLGVQSAKRGLEEAISNKDMQMSVSQSDVDNAKKAYDDVQNQINVARNTLNAKQGEQNALMAQYEQAKATYDAVKVEYDTRENAYTALTNSYNAQLAAVENAKTMYNQYFRNENGQIQQLDSNGAVINPSNYQVGNYATATHQSVDLAYIQANNTLASIEAEKNVATSNYLNYKTTFENASNAFTPLQSQYEAIMSEIASTQQTISTLEANANNLKTAYDKTVTAFNSTANTSDSTIASMRDTLTNSELSATSTSQTGQSQIKTYQEQLEKGTIVSTVNGTVTSVDVKPGDIYAGTNIATIEGCEAFIVQAEIDEYDIADVKVGMKVYIKTDATRDEELEGEVIYTALSATEENSAAMAMGATAGGNSSATYTVKIALNSPNERLRLGMNAKLSIVTESKENVWTVPYDTVCTREDGTKYIEILKNEDTKEVEQIDITTGIEGTYYIEVISDKLKDNMKVVVPKVETDNSIEELVELMGADAGL